MKVYDGPGFIAHRTGAADRAGPHRRRPPVGLHAARAQVPAPVLPADHAHDQPPRAPSRRPCRRDQWTLHVYQLLSESAFRAQNPAHSVYRELIVASRRHGPGRMIWEGHDGRGLTYAQILGRSAYPGDALRARDRSRARSSGS